jgi:wyosine [tRNA(Phe)-imidazoG37] synthetase (radical SAM superfamily)
MKLDAGNIDVFRSYNRPRKYVDLDIITEELSKMENITLQTLFCKGASGNYSEENINAWLQRVKKIKPLYVQIYSLDRGYPSDEIFPVNKKELNIIKDIVEHEGIKGVVFER